MADPPSSGVPKFRIVQGRGIGEARPQQAPQNVLPIQGSGGSGSIMGGGPPMQNLQSQGINQVPPSQQVSSAQISSGSHMIGGPPPQMQSQIQQGPPSQLQQVPPQMHQGPSPIMTQVGTTPAAAPSPAQQQQQGGGGSDEQSMVSKCVRFFKTLIQLSQQPDQQQGRNTAGRVKDLVTTVIFGVMPAEEFTVRLQEALKSQAQPHLLPFLQKTLPYLRTALQNGEVVIDGITPSPGMVAQGASQGRPPSNMSQPGPSPISNSLTSSPMPPGTPQQQIQPGAQSTQQLGNIQQQVTPPNQQFHGALGGPPQNVQVGQPPLRQSSQQQQQVPQTLQGDDELKPLINQRPPIQSADGPGQQTAAQQQIHPATAQQHGPSHEEQEVLQTRQLTESTLKSAILRPEEIMKKITKRMNEACFVDEDLLALISDATEYRLREMISELGIMAEHRLDPLRLNPNYIQIDDAKSQLKWIENLDRQQEEMRESREKEAIIRMSKSKSIGKDTLEKAKEMQRADAEAKRNRDANAAAIAALGGTKAKQQKWDSAGGGHAASLRPRTVRVNMRDLHTVVSSDPRCRRSSLLHKLSLAAPQTDPSI